MSPPATRARMTALTSPRLFGISPPWKRRNAGTDQQEPRRWRVASGEAVVIRAMAVPCCCKALPIPRPTHDGRIGERREVVGARRLVLPDGCRANSGRPTARRREERGDGWG